MAILADRRKLIDRYRAVVVANDELLTYTTLMHPDPNDPGNALKSRYVPARHHKVMAVAMEEVEAGRIKRIIINIPPRHGKTELASKSFPSWYIGRNPTKHLILGTYNEKFSWDFGREIRDMMQRPTYGQVFPSVRLKKGHAAVDRVQTEQGGVLAFVGRGGTITGRGGDLLIIDDPLKDRREADSPTIRQQLWVWFTQTFGSRMMTDEAAIILIQTRWHEDDLIGRLTDPSNPCYDADEALQWRVINLPALAEEDDPLGREPGEPLWPERFGKEFLEGRRRIDRRGFSALYQGQPSPEDGAFFTRDMIRTYTRMDQLPSVLRYYAASDHAVSTLQVADRTCLMVVGVDNAGDIWVLPDLVWARLQTDRAVEDMLRLMARYHPLFWWIERGPMIRSIKPFLLKRMAETQRYCAIDELPPIGDKVARAQSMHARMSSGRVWLPQFASWYDQALRELLKFPQAAHDDFVDTLSLIGLGLSKQVAATQPATVGRSIPARRSLAWVKWASDQDARRRALERNVEGW